MTVELSCIYDLH